MGDKPLTVPAFIATLLAVALFVTAILAWGGNIEPGIRAIGRISFFGCLAAFASCIVWHFVSTRARPDQILDVFAQVMDNREILQLGACHLYIQAVQASDKLKVVVAAQNRYDTECELNLSFKLKTGQEVLPAGIQNLNLRVGPSALILANYTVTLTPFALPRKLSFKPDGRCIRVGDGELVRFARRAYLQSDVKLWMTVLGAMGGGIYFGGARTWGVQLTPILGGDPDVVHPQWHPSELWTPESPTSSEKVADSIIAALSDN